MKQSLVQKTLSQPDTIATLQSWLSERIFRSRRAFGLHVCEQFGFQDELKRPQLASTMKALTTLESAKLLVLPAVKQACISSNKPAVLDTPVPLHPHIPQRLRKLGNIQVLLVQDPEHRKIWNRLMADEHPHGLQIFAGRQLRYLFHCPRYGYLGGIGFASSALKLSDRERWIGWTTEQRQQYLHYIVGLNRFLIRPGIHCRFLISHLLAKTIKAFKKDFKKHYGFMPWMIEIFCDPAHTGNSLKSANFIKIGHTKERGRQDRKREYARPCKTIFIYQLNSYWRKRLHLPVAPHMPVLTPVAGLDSQQWATLEFGGAPMGHRQLSERLVISAELLSQFPGMAIHDKTTGDASAIGGYYRFITKPAESTVTPKNILAPHRERTLQRIRHHKTVLAIMDATTFSFDPIPASQPITIPPQTHHERLSIPLHTTYVVTPECLPSGVIRCDFDPTSAHTPPEGGSAGMRDMHQLSTDITQQTQIVVVMDDRTSHFWQLFALQKDLKREDFLVRVSHHHRLNQQKKTLLASLTRIPSQHVHLDIDGCPPRHAPCALRYSSLTLKPPSKEKNASSITVWCIQLQELQPPKSETPIAWTLLTSIPLRDRHDALKIVNYYKQRQSIKDFFYVLKTRYPVEHSDFHAVESLQRVITIHAVLAWRAIVLCLLARTMPELEASLVYTEHELNLLKAYARANALNPPKNLSEALNLICSYEKQALAKNHAVTGPDSTECDETESKVSTETDFFASGKQFHRIYAEYNMPIPKSTHA